MSRPRARAYSEKSFRENHNEDDAAVLVLGGLLIFAPVLFMFVILPWITISEQGSDIFRPRTALEDEGRSIYVNNGCTYCHTQFIRNFDWDIGSERIAQSGDYVADSPHLLGTERTGPDLSEEGGEHPDDWHLAHFANPTVHPARVTHAFLGVSGPGENQGPHSLQAKPWIQTGRRENGPAKLLENRIDSSLRVRTR